MIAARRGVAGRGRRGVRLVALAAAVAVVATGCSREIEGTAMPESAFPGGGTTGNGTDIPDDVLRECELLDAETIAGAIGSDVVDQGFFGAICRWDGIGPTGTVRVTFNWFENGSLDVERRTNEELGYTVTDATIDGRAALRLTQPDTPSCGTAGPSPSRGVIGWWVHYLPGSTGDPCAAAETLMELSLNRAI